MTNHLGYMKHAVEGNNSGNSRNGKTKKTVKTGNGDIEIAVPRDRTSEFEPVLVEKRQSHLKGLDTQVLSLYARGMTVRDIQAHLTELYGTEISRESKRSPSRKCSGFRWDQSKCGLAQAPGLCSL